ncbi:putative regulatory protein alcR [Rosellinia necatrix]|uniref:Putative regulatory protein alcR n=1 Tax=Rosellinia necatrix TaxID=77044 RepID=A0A1S7UJ55_ROSNE|nr:putative regulatory protein alcR [Rosellinia necatrix]
MGLNTGAQSFLPRASPASPSCSPQEEEPTSTQLYLNVASQATDCDHLATILGTSQQHPIPSITGDLTQAAYRRRKSQRKSCRTRRRSDDQFEGLANSISPRYTSQGPMASFNNRLITESLLRIYHDVLENNLACWLAEDICPYKMRPGRSQPRSYSDAAVSMARGASPTAEWNLASSNSIYRRVKALDRDAQSAGLIRLAHSENRATSRALNLVIMAFATQWAQGHRRREKMSSVFPDPPNPTQAEDIDDDASDEFEQCFQQSLWEQAKKALEDVASLESYRVVYAELIFGLIQRPWAAKDDPRTSVFGPCDNNSSQGMDTLLPRIMEIMSQDGPPVYTERASRKMQALKFHFEASEAGFLGPSHPHTARQHEGGTSRMTAEDRGTIGILYWLAVMFDTVSSSLNERPVAVADEDCQHDAACSISAPTPLPTNYRWDLELFAQDNPASPSTISWPCSYELASKAVMRSAAVKVLLFRYVSYLQNALRKQHRGHTIEEIIQSVTQVYRYWNVTHGSFFRSLIKNYDSVPARIKSWFPCIHIPWHLGALMLADLIEFVDQNALGLEEATLERLGVNLAARIRKSSAVELADLARVTTPREADPVPTEQLPGYHFAVNEGSLLTEPWTVLLIRAFTKASIFHLRVAEDLRRQEWAILRQESEEYKESLRRCDTCVKALWFLGRKSDMARSLSKVLAEGLRSQEIEGCP